MAFGKLDWATDGNYLRAKISDEARGRLEYYREMYRNAIKNGSIVNEMLYHGQIKGYTDALAGFGIITETERISLTLYYLT